MKPYRNAKYFKRTVAGEDMVLRPAEWGASAIYFETSEENFPIRQIQIFQSGTVLVYDEQHQHDDYGWLDGNPICSEPPVTVSITSKEFHRAWMRHDHATNRQHTNPA